jgi:hypothetical protein
MARGRVPASAEVTGAGLEAGDGAHAAAKIARAAAVKQIRGVLIAVSP